jgi:rare lipoprotein A
MNREETAPCHGTGEPGISFRAPGGCRHFPSVLREIPHLTLAHSPAKYLTMKQIGHGGATLLLCCFAVGSLTIQVANAAATITQQKGIASWYGEANRGRVMANGRKFDPDKLTAASWFYPLGTRVRVTVSSPEFEPRSVLVTITDRGPAKRLVQQGRVIDLGRAAFQKLAHPDLGLVEVVVQPIQYER